MLFFIIVKEISVQCSDWGCCFSLIFQVVSELCESRGSLWVLKSGDGKPKWFSYKSFSCIDYNFVVRYARIPIPLWCLFVKQVILGLPFSSCEHLLILPHTFYLYQAFEACTPWSLLNANWEKKLYSLKMNRNQVKAILKFRLHTQKRKNDGSLWKLFQGWREG